MERQGPLLTHLDCYSHEWPALLTDVSPTATSPHIVVVRQVNVKHQLSLHWDEGGWERMGERQVLDIRNNILLV